MKILFLDIDGVLALPKNYATQRNKLHAKDRHAKGLGVPYMWDEKCVIALNRFIRMNDLEIVLSSDWRMHFTMDEIDMIFKINGVAKSPIGFTVRGGKMSAALEYNRVAEIEDWVEINRVAMWCAVDDMNLSKLGTRFVQTDERTGFAAKGFIEKMENALYPESRFAQQ
jgi:hypothetical protein